MSRYHYDTHSGGQYNDRTIVAKTLNNTFYKEGSISHLHDYPQAYTVADDMLAIPESTTSIYRSTSTGACPQRGAVKVTYRRNSRSRSRSRSRNRSFERGRPLHTTPRVSIEPLSDCRHSTQRGYVAADNMLAIPESTTSIYRSASTGVCPHRGAIKIIHRSNAKIGSGSRSRSRSTDRGRTFYANRPVLIDHRHHHHSRSYISRSMTRTPQTGIKVMRVDLKAPTKKTVTTTKVTTLKANDQGRKNLFRVRNKSRSRSPTTVVYREKNRSWSPTTVVYRKKGRSRSPTTVVYSAKSRSRSPTTVVYRKKSRSQSPTTVIYRKST